MLAVAGAYPADARRRPTCPIPQTGNANAGTIDTTSAMKMNDQRRGGGRTRRTPETILSEIAIRRTDAKPWHAILAYFVGHVQNYTVLPGGPAYADSDHGHRSIWNRASCAVSP